MTSYATMYLAAFYGKPSTVMSRIDFFQYHEMSSTPLFSWSGPYLPSSNQFPPTDPFKMFEKYTALKQADDETIDSALDSRVKIESRRSRSRSPYLWFISGFLAALVTGGLLAFTYEAVTRREKIPTGLIPDCMLTRCLDQRHILISYSSFR
jgi:hypothetical protein